MIDLDKVKCFLTSPYQGGPDQVLILVCVDKAQAGDVYGEVVKLIRWFCSGGVCNSQKGWFKVGRREIYVTCSEGYSNFLSVRADYVLFDSEVSDDVRFMFNSRVRAPFIPPEPP